MRGQLITGRKRISKDTGISERSIRTCIKRLKSTSEVSVKTTNKYSIITLCNYDDYQVSTEQNDQQNDQLTANKRPASDQQVTTNRIKDIYSPIIAHLNTKTGKNFNPSSKKTQSLINSRIKEGFTKQDFFTVIDNKHTKWFTDPKMCEYLRPETIFGTKFESYLNDTPHPLQGKVSAKTIKNIQNMENWEPPE